MHIKINEKKNKIKTLNFEEIKLSDNNVNLNLNISLEISILQKTQKKNSETPHRREITRRSAKTGG